MKIKMSNKEVLFKFLGEKEVTGKSELTIERYKYVLVKLFKYCLLSYKEITADNINDYFAENQSRGLSNRTIDGERKILSSFYGWAKKREFLIFSNPMDMIGPIKYKKKIRKPFSQAERERIKMSCKRIRDLALVEFLYSTGARVSEVVRLDVKDINFFTKEVIVTGKGNKERVVYLSELAEQYLKEYLESRTDNLEALFVSVRHPFTRLSKGGIESTLKRLEEKSGVFNVHPHRYRRTLASDLAQRGVPIQVISKILGHENIDVTNLYVYTSNSSVKSNFTNALNNY